MHKGEKLRVRKETYAGRFNWACSWGTPCLRVGVSRDVHTVAANQITPKLLNVDFCGETDESKIRD